MQFLKSPVRISGPKRQRGHRGVTDGLPIDYSSNFDGPGSSPGDDIIEFLMEIGWPEDSPRTKEMARNPFVSFSNQFFSLATTEAGTPTHKLNGPRRTVTMGKAACGASAMIERIGTFEGLFPLLGNEN